MTTAVSEPEGLNVLHQRLEVHFDSVRSRRDEFDPGVPIFALEHGLSDIEVALLKDSVCDAVQRGQLSNSSWLPFVVYASEIGYEYSGDEYWRTFAARTPGWTEHGDREFIRARFLEFARMFGGARPSGAWARNFSIICWPITHAVLPTDLQRQLVQLLFDYRQALTFDLLVNPSELGSRLAARAWHCSSRFQNFAQNTSLLGQVAAALLGDEEEECPYLLSSTLNRILEKLSAERVARTWLRDAQSSASRVRSRGFRPSSGVEGGGSESHRRPRLPSPIDPGIFLKLEPLGWTVHLYLPDLSDLAERLPGVYELLNRHRVRVAGSLGAPLAQRRLLIPGQRLRLDEWPDLHTPLFQLEGEGLESENRLLADQCVLGAGPVRLFRVREPGLAEVVKGKFVRPGQEYIILDESSIDPSSLPTYVIPCASTTKGIVAYHVDVPRVVEARDMYIMESFGLSVLVDIGVRPVGAVPGGWDGEGAAEWLAGEDVILAVSSSRSITRCIVSIAGRPQLLDWPRETDEIFLCLTDLEIGVHEVKIGLLSEVTDEFIAEGSLAISVRAAQSRPATGTFREGLMLLTTPLQPTLSELWDGRAVVTILGPPNTPVLVEVRLVNARDSVLASMNFKMQIPQDATGWLRQISRKIRNSKDLNRHYDEAEALVMTVFRANLGAATLRCGREFAPLRWVVGSDRDGAFARLINNVESSSIAVDYYEFYSPAMAIPISYVTEAPVRWPDGCLLRARDQEFETSIILPPTIHNLEDLRRTSVVPNFPRGIRTVDEIFRLIQLSALWASASLSADPFAEGPRSAVLKTITVNLVSVIAGSRWSRIEEQGLRSDSYSFLELQTALGEESYQRGLGNEIRGRLLDLWAKTPSGRPEQFCEILAVFRSQTMVERTDWRFAEFLLRLASEPSTLADWPEDEVRSALDRVLVSPVLVRAARFIVLAIHLDETDDDAGGEYRGWPWQ